MKYNKLMSKITTKKYLITLLLLAFTLTILSSSVLAKDVYDMVDEYNQKIEEEIDYAQDKAEEILARDDNEVDIAQKIEKIIDKLIEKTDEIAAKTNDKAEKLGYEVECSDKEVTVGGQTVLIDPLIVLAD